MRSPLLIPRARWKAVAFPLFLAASFTILSGCNDNEASQAASMRNIKSNGYITVTQNNINVGTIEMSKGTIDIPFLFRNDGNEPLALLEGETSCMCTTASIKSKAGRSQRMTMRGHGVIARMYHVLDPGEEATLIATFDPNAHGPSGTGQISRDVIVQTNSSRTPSMQFRFMGNVVP
ncbi:hypothetical protein COU76_03215 [Candidatus Peregrinibacteria bacterium CG10_big_fil_rev_8_21_14_0_10_49_10]|nr:MAG: hypothetical protein COU76_03215 [Candidatus Peregrinibacteria bacterium CG10_big_fil_rev_8_21_14_0_10_49_10]